MGLNMILSKNFPGPCRTRKSIVVVLIMITWLGFSACAQGPSDEAAKKAVTDYLNENIPATWLVGAQLNGVVGNFIKESGLVKGAEVKIDLLEIQQRGNFNEEGKYWPLKVHVKGSCVRTV